MLTVPSTPVEDNATFSITALNSRGVGVIVSDSDYPEPSIDTKAVNDGENTLVPEGFPSYRDT